MASMTKKGGKSRKGMPPGLQLDFEDRLARRELFGTINILSIKLQLPFRVQTLNWHCHRTGRVRPISRHNSTRGQEISFSLEDSINFRDSRLCEISRARDERLEERPRISLALQMAELDRRREAIRKQRYNREFLNFVDERRASAEEYSGRPYGSAMLAVMQDPSFQAEFDEVLQHRCCANAA